MAKGKTNRNEPKTARSSEATATLLDFERRFPDDASCLEWLVGHLYPEGIFCPKCQKVTKHHRVKSRTCYECQFCGHQEYPMRGTIFEGSSTSLRLWFYGIYVMASTRCGISAKQLEREIGVSYPTAHRMFKQIRTLLAPDGEMLSGTVEADEVYLGGKEKWKKNPNPYHQGSSGKTIVMGMVQRKTKTAPGKIVVQMLGNTTYGQITDQITGHVLPASTVYTDEYKSYRRLPQMGYQHERVHHRQRVYVSGNVHTNTIEGFWSLLRRGIGGTYHSVSTKHLQSYLNEYAFRYNSRENPVGMFDAFLNRIAKASPASPDPS